MLICNFLDEQDTEDLVLSRIRHILLGGSAQKPLSNIIYFFAVDHMGERPHKCKECGETFKHLIVLKRHVNVIHLKIKQTW